MKKAYFILSLFMVMFSLFGCGNLTEKEYQARQEGRLTYTWEDVEATITKIDTRHWFAGTHRYEWSIEVYYEPYDLEFTENSWANGAFNRPSFFNKLEGDFISVEICNKYIDGELIGRHISRIKY